MAKVAIDRLESDTKFSISSLQVETDIGCLLAISLKVRIAANRKDDLEEDMKC